MAQTSHREYTADSSTVFQVALQAVRSMGAILTEVDVQSGLIAAQIGGRPISVLVGRADSRATLDVSWDPGITEASDVDAALIAYVESVLVGSRSLGSGPPPKPQQDPVIYYVIGAVVAMIVLYVLIEVVLA